MISLIARHNGISYFPTVNRNHPLVVNRLHRCHLFGDTLCGTYKTKSPNLVVGKRWPATAATDAGHPHWPTEDFGCTDNVGIRRFDGWSGFNGAFGQTMDSTGHYYGKHSGWSSFAVCRGPMGNAGPTGSDERYVRESGAPLGQTPGSDATPNALQPTAGNNIWPARVMPYETKQEYMTLAWVHRPPSTRCKNCTTAYVNGQAVSVSQADDGTVEATQNCFPYAIHSTAAVTSTIMILTWYGIPLSDHEVSSLNADPFQIFVRPPMLAGTAAAPMILGWLGGGPNPARNGDFNTGL